jgi:hypothetical protein
LAWSNGSRRDVAHARGEPDQPRAEEEEGALLQYSGLWGGDPDYYAQQQEEQNELKRQAKQSHHRVRAYACAAAKSSGH